MPHLINAYFGQTEPQGTFFVKVAPGTYLVDDVQILLLGLLGVVEFGMRVGMCLMDDLHVLLKDYSLAEMASAPLII
jgi:hypothetical protein